VRARCSLLPSQKRALRNYSVPALPAFFLDNTGINFIDVLIAVDSLRGRWTNDLAVRCIWGLITKEEGSFPSSVLAHIHRGLSEWRALEHPGSAKPALWGEAIRKLDKAIVIAIIHMTAYS